MKIVCTLDEHLVETAANVQFIPAVGDSIILELDTEVLRRKVIRRTWYIKNNYVEKLYIETKSEQ